LFTLIFNVRHQGRILVNPQFFVITEASGGDKSILIEVLAELGYSAVPEAALAIMREQIACNGKILPDTDREAFMRTVIARSIKDHEAAQSLEAPVFSDRGIPEWLRFFGPDEAQCRIAAQCRYTSTVFLAEPWSEIYVRDHYRQHSFTQAAKSYESTVSSYIQANYETCILQKVSVQERVAFILNQVGVGARQIAAANRQPASRAAVG
jgi:predicted ATPase